MPSILGYPDFAFAGPTYQQASPVLNGERAINLYPEPGIRSSFSPMGLIGRPGLGNIGSTLPRSPIRSLWAGVNRMFTAAGTHIYEINNTGGVIQDYGAIPSTTGKGPVDFFSNGQQLLACDGIAQTINYVDPIGLTLTQVLTGTSLEYLDGFHVAIASGASLAGTNPNQINCSDFLSAGTVGSWNALNYVIRAEVADLPIRLAVLNNLLYIFGLKTCSIWYNAGNQGFPFALMSNGVINLGCLSPFTVVKFYNSIVWLGADDHGYAQVYMMQGTNPVRVSNFAIEQMLASSLANLVYSTAFGYQEAGHTFWCLNICNSSYQPVQQLVYDMTTGLWHERAYAAAWPQCFAAYYPTFIDLVGDGLSGNIYNQSILFPSDDGTAITYTRTAPHVSKDFALHRYNRLDILMALTGAGLSTPCTLDYSNNGGRSFLGLTTPLTHAVDQINPSSFIRYYTQQLGTSRDRVFQWTTTDSANLIRIAGASLNVD